MKKIIVKILIGIVLILGVSDIAYSQKLEFPTNVRYIGGGYIAKKPYYPTLEGALNNVKALATPENPYVFWVDSDTMQIADWDSVFTASGLTMKDSIDAFYASTGSIKWAGFGFGGEGGGSSIASPTLSTTYYNFPNWNPATNPPWLDSLAMVIDSTDKALWELIVYTDSALYIENDTLKINLTVLKQRLEAAGISGGSGWNPDTTRIVMKDLGGTLTAVYLLTGSLKATGNGMVAVGSYHDGIVPRVIYATADSMMTTLNGTTIETIAFRSWVRSNYVPLAYEDSIALGGQGWFVDQDTSVTVSAIGIDTTSIIVITPLSYGNVEVLSVILGNDSFSVRRAAAGRANLKFNWALIRGKYHGNTAE